MGRDGPVTGKYTGDRTYTGHNTFAQGVSGAGLQIVKDSQIWYVDKNKTSPAASGDGLSWEGAFLTLTEAIAAAGDYDVIFVGQGIYDEAGFPLTITQTGLKLLGAGSSGYNWGPCALKSSASADTILQVDANGVEIAGIDFNLYTNAKSGIVLGFSQSIYKTHIHDCFFGCSAAGGAEGECGIAVGMEETGTADGGFDAVDTHIERCGFHYLATAAIAAYGTRLKVNNCIFWTNTGIGINVFQEGSARACTMIIDNYIMGRAGGDTGIKIAATEPDPGTLMIANNCITYCSTLITASKCEEALVNNNTHVDGSTYLQVDT